MLVNLEIKSHVATMSRYCDKNLNQGMKILTMEKIQVQVVDQAVKTVMTQSQSRTHGPARDSDYYIFISPTLLL